MTRPAMTTFPLNSVRARVTAWGDAWMTDGSTMARGNDLQAEVADEIAMAVCSNAIYWCHVHQRDRRETMWERASIGLHGGNDAPART